MERYDLLRRHVIGHGLEQLPGVCLIGSRSGERPPNPSIKASTAMDRIALAVLIPGGISVVSFNFGWFSLVFIVFPFLCFHGCFLSVHFNQLDLTRPSRSYRTIRHSGVDFCSILDKLWKLGLLRARASKCVTTQIRNLKNCALDFAWLTDIWIKQRSVCSVRPDRSGLR